VAHRNSSDAFSRVKLNASLSSAPSREFGSSAIDIDFEAGGSRGMRGALAALRRLCAVVKDSFLAWTSCSIRALRNLYQSLTSRIFCPGGMVAHRNSSDAFSRVKLRGALAALRRLCAVVKDSFLAWTSCSIRDIHVLSIVRVRDGTGGPGGSNCHDQR
jgi:hypothetical protein